jgi:hypothetical protein
MTKNDKNPNLKPAWQSQVLGYFEEKKLSQTLRDSFKSSILNTPVITEENYKTSITQEKIKKNWSTTIISSAVSALLAASVTLIVVKNSSDEQQDPIAELAQLPGPRVYPPDFDLEGDSKAMQDIVYELFSDKDFFVSKLPAQVLAEYKPSEGRFFSWDGEPAVSIQMNKNSNTNGNPTLSKLGSDPATLFIVKLSERSQRKFPKEKVTRKVAGQAGKMHKVKVWREGKFGYAMVQSVAVTDATP